MAGNQNSGRKAQTFKPEERMKVKVLTASGMSQIEIAEVIGCTAPTLRKHFKEELLLGSAHVKAEIVMARYHAAMSGNVSAQNKMIEMTGAAVPTIRAPEETPAKKKLGKKEQANQEANRPPEDPGWGSVLNIENQKPN